MLSLSTRTGIGLIFLADILSTILSSIRTTVIINANLKYPYATRILIPEVDQSVALVLSPLTVSPFLKITPLHKKPIPVTSLYPDNQEVSRSYRTQMFQPQ